jgi:carboxyl-terminal processing protease
MTFNNPKLRVYSLLIFISFSVFIINIQAQTKSQIMQLSDLCHVWGLLKYYHPEIASGKHDWDAVLISSIDTISKSKDKNQLQPEIEKMLEIAGDNASPEISSEVDSGTDESFKTRNLNFSWIEKSKNLTFAQKQRLQHLTQHPFQGVNYYAQTPPGDEAIATQNEKPYQEMTMPDQHYRLLGLFRFWNVINYYYPYKYAIGQPWENVLQAMIPQFAKAEDQAAYHRALLKLAASINDGHSSVYPFVIYTVSGKYMPPFNFRVAQNKAVVTKIIDSSALGNSGIKEGSVIEAINKIPVSRKLKEYWDYVEGSNAEGKIKGLHKLVLNSDKTTAIFSGYNPDGAKFSAEVQLSERDYLKNYEDFFEMTSSTVSKMVAPEVAYVYYTNLTAKNYESVLQPLMKTKAIIFDMRNYPVKTPVYSIPEFFLSKPTVYARVTRPDFRHPGTFIYETANIGTTAEKVGKINPNPYQGKVILLVDSRTQSAAEWSCMIMQTYGKVTVIGSPTAGADGNVTRTVVPGGHRLNFSGLGIYYPDHRETQRVGIPIDIRVDYTIKDLIAKNDPVLKRAVEFINLEK